MLDGFVRRIQVLTAVYILWLIYYACKHYSMRNKAADENLSIDKQIQKMKDVTFEQI